MLVLIVTAVIVVSVTVCLKRKRKEKMKNSHVNTTENIAYGIGHSKIDYASKCATDVYDYLSTSGAYDYLPTTTSGNDKRVATFPNKAYAMACYHVTVSSLEPPTDDWCTTRAS